MAYMSFTPWEAHDAPAVQLATVEDAADFSPLELRVIAIGERDDVSREISYQSRTGRFLENILGIKLGRPLADGRLENLRRFASLAWHHPDRVDDEAIEALIDAGFSTGQTYGLLRHISRRHRAARAGITA